MNPDAKPYLLRVLCFAIFSASTAGLCVGAFFGMNLWIAFMDALNCFALAYMAVDVWRGKLQVCK